MPKNPGNSGHFAACMAEMILVVVSLTALMSVLYLLLQQNNMENMQTNVVTNVGLLIEQFFKNMVNVKDESQDMVYKMEEHKKMLDQVHMTNIQNQDLDVIVKKRSRKKPGKGGNE